MKIERYDLVEAFEGPVSQEILHRHLKGYRSVELLSPPWKKQIALIAKADYPIHVYDGDVNDTQRFLAAYRYTGLIDEQELQALRSDPRVVVECSGEFRCLPSPAGMLEPFVTNIVGRMKSYWADGAFILLTEGQQHGDFECAFAGGGGTLANVAQDGEVPIYKATASSPENLALLQESVKEMNGGRPVVEDNTEAGVLELMLRLSDNELQRMNGHRIKDLKDFREFLRRKQLERRS